MAITRVPANLITGFGSTGKTPAGLLDPGADITHYAVPPRRDQVKCTPAPDSLMIHPEPQSRPWNKGETLCVTGI